MQEEGGKGKAMNTLWSIIVPAIAGLLAGVVGSLVAPWVNWTIEKRREKMKYRREFIQRCREKIESADFDRFAFFATHEYLTLKQFLSPDMAKDFGNANHVICVVGGCPMHVPHTDVH